MRDVMSPLDGTFLANVPISTAAMLDEQLECANVAASELALQPRFQRIAWLRALHSGLLADMDSLTITMAHEIGKPVLLARIELERALTLIDHTIAVLMTESGDAPYVDDQPAHAARTVMTKRFPIGIVAAITPFNFPINLVFHKILPAIATGCPVIVKPSERTHAISSRLADIISRSGIPTGAVQFDFADDGPLHARMLASDKRVAFLSFTGSDTAGRTLSYEAAGKPQIMELGGSAAVYIGDGADIKAAAKKCAIAAMSYAGQVCISVQRIYVHQRLFNLFRDALIAEITAITPMDPRTDGHVLGPMIDTSAVHRLLAHCDSLSRSQLLVTPHVHDARFVSPCVVAEIPNEHPLIQQEAFAPVVVLQRVDDLSSAIVQMNGTDYGLQHGVFTNRMQDALQAHNQLRGGAVYINDVPTVRMDKLAYGGEGASGVGREGISDVIRAYTSPRHLVFS